MNREIEVWADWHTLGGAVLMGSLSASMVRGREIFAFEYTEDWLSTDHFREIDPDLQFFGGQQYLDGGDKPNFGMFLDSSPDRWGRLLMRRREALKARDQGRKPKRLQELDFLLGVHDEQRLGALRFKEAGSAWLNSDPSMLTPPWALLRELEHASWKLQAAEANEKSHYREWLNLLIAPGSSLGGARAKAGVRDERGDLWIAKFPGRNDCRDIGAWEMVTYQLAGEAGIDVVNARLERFSKGHRTFMSQRFDRVAGKNGRQRIHFASAMTLLGHNDGDDSLAGVSYLELVEFIARGASPAADLEELWRRIVFSIAVRNTDDHLRNHGFLLTEEGWRLSPAYDINPEPEGLALSLNISEDDNSLDFDLAREVAPWFRVKEGKVVEIIKNVRAAVSRWRVVAEEYGISRSEQEGMATAFEE